MSDHEVPGGALDERIHLADLARQGLLVEQAIGHIPVKGIERAETISGIRPAQILLHFPDHATPRHDERIVDLPRECHTLFAIERTIAAKHGKRIEPHGEIVEILAFAVRLLADADAARPPEHAIDLGHQSFGLIEITFTHRSTDSASRSARSAPCASRRACRPRIECRSAYSLLSDAAD